MKKRVAVVTGTRAEYGLLRPVLKKMNESESLTPLLIVTGTHLSESYGLTVKEIEKDSVPIAEKIDILKFGSSEADTAKTVALTIELFTDWFCNNKPDACLVLGDRYEIFAVASAAAMLRIPLIHISGGDVTQGAADDFFRHSITKMASLHFPSCEEYAKRLIRMGEAPEIVHNVGGLGDENIRSIKLMDKNELSESLGFDLTNRFALVTYHPETLADCSPIKQFDELLKALDGFENLALIFTKANADAGGAEINNSIDDYVKMHKNNTIAFTSMGVVRYLSAMRLCSAVIGNSSSGVVETPTFGVPCVNIGDRQKGRIICNNVICCKTNTESIKNAINTALSAKFAEDAAKTVSPYSGGDTSGKIVNIISEFLNSDKCRKPKVFYDDI